MTSYGDLSVLVTESQLGDGSVVYAACLEQMPGVVAEGSSESVAVSELIALLKDLHERLPLPVFAVRTAAVGSWNWTIQTSGEPALSYGPSAAWLRLAAATHQQRLARGGNGLRTGPMRSQFTPLSS